MTTAVRFNTTQEVADILRTDANKVRQLIRRGELSAIPKFPGRERNTYLVSDQDLARYLATLTRGAA